MQTAATIALETWRTLCEMAPYLLLGFFMAGVLSVLVSPATVERHLGGRGFWPVFKAALFGVPLPLCSCGVIPVAASLSRHGASQGATTAFVVSTPQTGVDSILVTYALLGPVFAIFRPAAALVSGILGGMLVDVFDRKPATGAAAPATAAGTESCALPTAGKNRSIRALEYAFVTLPRDIARPLLLGLLVAGVISALVPDHFFSQTIGTGLVSMLVMMAVGIPLYVCATASVPMAAAMMLKGISPGAALVFLMTGPATNAAAIATYWKLLGKRATGLYLFAVAATALASGILLDAIFKAGQLVPPAMCHTMGPGPWGVASAVVLLLVLGFAFLPRRAQAPGSGHGAPTPNGGATATFKVNGMTCSHCAETARRTLLEVPGIFAAEIDLKRGRARVTGAGYDRERMKAALAEVGFALGGEIGTGDGD